jgi:hypothetical protein
VIGQIEIIRPYVRNDVAGEVVFARVEENVTHPVRIVEPWVQSSVGTTKWLEAANSTVSHLAEVVYQGRRIKASANDIVEQASVWGDTQPRFRYRSTGLMEWGQGNAVPDTNLFRSAANTLKTDDKLIAALGLGVGNSVAASVPGTLTRKLEVFDASGVSLGFIAIYESIS